MSKELRFGFYQRPRLGFAEPGYRDVVRFVFAHCHGVFERVVVVSGRCRSECDDIVIVLARLARWSGFSF